jgi:hypothetical protein
MALSTLNPPLPALEDLITLTPRPAKKKIGPRLTRDIRRDTLLLRKLNDYDGDEAEYTCERIAELLSKRHRRTITQIYMQQTKSYPPKRWPGEKADINDRVSRRG